MNLFSGYRNFEDVHETTRHHFRDLGTSSTGDDRHEVFDYDALNRLEEADHLASDRTLTTDSDVYGNLTVKTSDVSGDLDVTSYSYPTSANPTRLASVSIGGVSNTLVYDAIGNITRYNAVSGDDTYIAYDAANRATEITVGASETTATPTARDEFWYGVDEHRILKRSSWDDAGQQESRWDLYLWGQFEQSHSDLDPNIVYVQRVRVTETTQHRHKQKTAGTAAYVEYLHRDHLGSVTAATYYNGSTLFEAAYDPFGSRREADGTADLPSSGLAQLQVFEDNVGMRGFTDHEHLDRTGFIHMNGRVFDPRIGRFIQPDPIVQAPAFSQSYNRYAYVFNSPLSYTDPSGFATNTAVFEDVDIYEEGGNGPIRINISGSVWDQFFSIPYHLGFDGPNVEPGSDFPVRVAPASVDEPAGSDVSYEHSVPTFVSFNPFTRVFTEANVDYSAITCESCVGSFDFARGFDGYRTDGRYSTQQLNDNDSYLSMAVVSPLLATPIIRGIILGTEAYGPYARQGAQQALLSMEIWTAWVGHAQTLLRTLPANPQVNTVFIRTFSPVRPRYRIAKEFVKP